jgi:hypothetical protein
VVEQATKRASASLHAGLLDRALAEIELAYNDAGKIASDDLRERTEAGLMVVRGAALAGQDPSAALASPILPSTNTSGATTASFSSKPCTSAAESHATWATLPAPVGTSTVPSSWRLPCRRRW